MSLYTNDIMEAIDNPPDPARVIEGLRDTGYDFNTAIADIVDNSIAANAGKIAIYIHLLPNGELAIYIADDGIGMNLDELKNAMRYGSDRRPDPHSLGKFGLGLKTASTAFCRKLSLVSVDDSGEINKVQWDLDYVAQVGWKLKQLQPSEDEVELLKKTCGNDTGTLVVWETIDRLLRTKTTAGRQNELNKILSSLSFHLSVVYQRFLDPAFKLAENLEIKLNGTLIEPWDPFFKDEPNTELLAHEAPQIELPDGRVTQLELKAYAIPRKDTYSSLEKQADARISVNTMGFYVYRENRLIHYGDWLGMYTKDPHDSLCRVEFSFDHELDDALNVDIKKSRVRLQEDIFNHIKDNFLPAPKRAANKKYRKGQNITISNTSTNAHTASNNNIAEKASQVESSKITVTNPATNEVQVQNSKGTFTTHVIKIIEPTVKGECRVVPRDDVENNCLWEPAIVEGQHAVIINKKHPYYQKVYYPVLEESVLITGMDALLWALAEVENSTVNDEMLDFYEDFRYQVSKKLKQLVRDLPEPELEDEE